MVARSKLFSNLNYLTFANKSEKTLDERLSRFNVNWRASHSYIYAKSVLTMQRSQVHGAKLVPNFAIIQGEIHDTSTG